MQQIFVVIRSDHEWVLILSKLYPDQQLVINPLTHEKFNLINFPNPHIHKSIIRNRGKNRLIAMAHQPVDSPGVSLNFSLKIGGGAIKDSNNSVSLSSYEEILFVWNH